MKIKVVDAFNPFEADEKDVLFGYKNGDVLKVSKIKSENGCWTIDKNGNERFLLKHEYIVLEEEK